MLTTNLTLYSPSPHLTFSVSFVKSPFFYFPPLKCPLNSSDDFLLMLNLGNSNNSNNIFNLLLSFPLSQPKVTCTHHVIKRLFRWQSFRNKSGELELDDVSTRNLNKTGKNRAYGWDISGNMCGLSCEAATVMVHCRFQGFIHTSNHWSQSLQLYPPDKLSSSSGVQCVVTLRGKKHKYVFFWEIIPCILIEWEPVCLCVSQAEESTKKIFSKFQKKML